MGRGLRVESSRGPRSMKSGEAVRQFLSRGAIDLADIDLGIIGASVDISQEISTVVPQVP